MSPIALSLREASEVSSKSRSKLYEAIKGGKLRAVKDGRRTLVMVRDLEAYLESLPALKTAQVAA